ncbi:MAG: hypothetical protein AAGL98_10205, partial [Planctomycetota bacterium]
PVPRRDLWSLETRSGRPWDAFRAGGVTRLGGISLLTPILVTLRKMDGVHSAWDQVPTPPDLRRYGEGLIHYADRRFDEAATELQPLFDTLTTQAGQKQWALHAGRILLESQAVGRPADHAALRATIDRMLALCPSGPLQDADCLDLCGYLLAESGDEAAAWSVDRMCLESPSTTAEHVMQLAVRNVVRDSKNADRVAWLREVVIDLRNRGVPLKEIDIGFNTPIRRALGAGRAKWITIQHD